jgi:hypothetical protein
MERPHGAARSLALSYLGLRKAIGIIGIALPFVLAAGKVILDGPGIQGSISAYYYTVMGDVFVGSLSAIGVFLLSYRYSRHDIIAATVAGIASIGVALFPTAPEAGATPTQKAIAIAHGTSAAIFFLTLAYMSLFLFTRTHPAKTPKARKPADYVSQLFVTRTLPGVELGIRKKTRNLIYRVSGFMIVASVALILVMSAVPAEASVRRVDPVFWLESIAVVSFGVSWLVKGETILKDKKARGSGRGELP